ncbi:hypothetical protein [Treponema sp.]|uniref:hypothetical protein n=1 Tax=Treponema sp. TaxID=166 RepID=UPI003FA33683
MTESAKKAIAVIDNAQQKGALVFVTREDCVGVTPLYKPEVTVINLRLPKAKYDNDADVYDIQGKYMPKREIVDRIGEATGLVFIREGCRTWTELREDDIAGKRTVFMSEQQAKKRLSDGSFRTSSVQTYEFDPVLRAMVDFNVTELNAGTKQTKLRDGGKTLAQTILENTKVARQRAETGARLRVIRELTNMPTAFSKTDAAKPLIFGRIAQNTDYILQTPEGRAMASAQALGIDVAALFGGRKFPAAEQEALVSAQPVPEALSAAGEAENEETYLLEAQTSADESSYTADMQGTNGSEEKELFDPAGSAEQAPERANGNSEFETLTEALDQWCEAYRELLNVTLKNGSNPYQLAQAELDANNFAATVETRKAMIVRIKKYLEANGVRI